MKRIETLTCKSCRKPLPPNCEFKTHEECRKRAAMNRQKTRDNKVTCKGVKKDGTRCTHQVDPEFDEFCKKHGNNLRNDPVDVIRCNSRIRCNENEPGVKAILPKGSAYKQCENCRMHQRLLDQRNRNAKDENDLCPKCPDGTVLKLSQRAIKNDGTRSKYCKKHFEIRKKADQKRNEKNHIEKDLKIIKPPASENSDSDSDSEFTNSIKNRIGKPKLQSKLNGRTSTKKKPIVKKSMKKSVKKPIQKSKSMDASRDN